MIGQRRLSRTTGAISGCMRCPLLSTSAGHGGVDASGGGGWVWLHGGWPGPAAGLRVRLLVLLPRPRRQVDCLWQGPAAPGAVSASGL